MRVYSWLKIYEKAFICSSIWNKSLLQCESPMKGHCGVYELGSTRFSPDVTLYPTHVCHPEGKEASPPPPSPKVVPGREMVEMGQQ